MTKLVLYFSVCMFLIQSIVPVKPSAEKDDSLWRECTYASSNRSREGIRELWDANASSDFIIKGPGELSISWEDQVPAQSLYLEWNIFPADFTVTQYSLDGTAIATVPGETYELNQLYQLLPETCRVSIKSETTMDLCTAVVYGPNVIPADYHPWERTPDKLDYLIIVAHPDDDAIFMAAIVPTYGVERGLKGTILYTCSSNIRYRCNEALNGAWVMGLRYHPIFAGFPDILPSLRKKWEFQFTVEKLTPYYVRIIRKYKPEVIVTHDTEGEYGHWQHKYVSKAVCDAIGLAADASYDAESASQYGVFQVKKTYLHLYPENKIILDVSTPLSQFDSKSIRQISKAAFDKHVSQTNASHYDEKNEGVYSLSDYGLFYSTVGADKQRNDMFEHIDPRLLSNYAPPTPAPTSSPKTELQIQNLENSDATTPVPEEKTNRDTESWFVYALFGLAVAIISVGALYLGIKINKHNKK